jgi:hypothetical protein
VSRLCERAAGAEEIVRPRRLVWHFRAALNFTVSSRVFTAAMLIALQSPGSRRLANCTEPRIRLR